MTRDCRRCGFTLPVEAFALSARGRRRICEDCRGVNVLIGRVAAIAVDGILRLCAIDALLYMGYIRAAHLIARGATEWPTILELREGTGYASTAVAVDLVRR